MGCPGLGKGVRAERGQRSQSTGQLIKSRPEERPSDLKV